MWASAQDKWCDRPPTDWTPVFDPFDVNGYPVSRAWGTSSFPQVISFIGLPPELPFL